MSGDRDLFHDRALDTPEQDRFARQPFARFLAEAILTMDAEESFVFALHGSWGSGKSTVLNFLEFYLTHPGLTGQPSASVPVVVKFNPWCFSGTEQLFRQFFSEFRTALGQRIDPASGLKTVAGHLETLSRALTPLKWIPGIAVPAGVAQETIMGLQGAADSAARLLETDVNAAKSQIRSALLKSDARFVVLIDDIDRLRPEEMIQVFQLVKAVADFPRTLYVLSFDRAAVKRALRGLKVDEPDQYLEKIVQAPFDLPDPDPSTVRTLFEEQLRQLRATASPATAAENRFWIELFDRGISMLVRRPRDLKRLLNILRYSYPPVRDEVYFPDFVAITAIRLSAPDVYEFLAFNKDLMTTIFMSSGAEDPRILDNRQRFNAVMETAPAEERPFIQHVLRRVFAVWDQAYGGFLDPDNGDEWLRQRRSNAAEAFDTYFRLSVLPSSVSAAEMRGFLRALSDEVGTGDYLVRASKQRDPDGKKRIEKVLRVLPAYVPEIPLNQKWILATVLLTRGDELCELDDWSYYGPFCDDLIAALVQRLLLYFPPGQDRLEFMGQVFGRDPKLATIAAFYVRAGRDAVFDEAGVKWFEKELRTRLPNAVYSLEYPLYSMMVAWELLDPTAPTRYAQTSIWVGPAGCEFLLRFFHGAGAVDGTRMRDRVRKLHDWARSSAPGLSPLFPWRTALAEPLDWLDDERRRGLERILEADAIAASPPVAGAM